MLPTRIRPLLPPAGSVWSVTTPPPWLGSQRRHVDVDPPQTPLASATIRPVPWQLPPFIPRMYSRQAYRSQLGR
jgi:hypothetical protein